MALEGTLSAPRIPHTCFYVFPCLCLPFEVFVCSCLVIVLFSNCSSLAGRGAREMNKSTKMKIDKEIRNKYKKGIFC